jgi:hypothetical protein
MAAAIQNHFVATRRLSGVSKFKDRVESAIADIELKIAGRLLIMMAPILERILTDELDRIAVPKWGFEKKRKS